MTRRHKVYTRGEVSICVHTCGLKIDMQYGTLDNFIPYSMADSLALATDCVQVCYRPKCLYVWMID